MASTSSSKRKKRKELLLFWLFSENHNQHTKHEKMWIEIKYFCYICLGKIMSFQAWIKRRGFDLFFCWLVSIFFFSVVVIIQIKIICGHMYVMSLFSKTADNTWCFFTVIKFDSLSNCWSSSTHDDKPLLE